MVLQWCGESGLLSSCARPKPDVNCMNIAGYLSWRHSWMWISFGYSLQVNKFQICHRDCIRLVRRVWYTMLAPRNLEWLLIITMIISTVDKYALPVAQHSISVYRSRSPASRNILRRYRAHIKIHLVESVSIKSSPLSLYCSTSIKFIFIMFVLDSKQTHEIQLTIEAPNWFVRLSTTFVKSSYLSQSIKYRAYHNWLASVKWRQ